MGKRTKIVMTRSLLPGDQKYIIDGLQGIVGDCFDLVAPQTYDDEGLKKVVPDADVLLGPYVSKAVLNTAKGLKLIQVPWTGMDTFDFKAMVGFESIPVCNSHSNASVVAELGVTIVLDLLKKVSYHDRKMRKGNWNRDQIPLDLKSKMLNQQTVAVLGYGKIGSRVGSLLHAFGASIIAIEQREITYPDINWYPIEKTYTAIGNADVVIVAIPLTDSTKGSVNADFISHMKDGSFLVLLSRAAIVDEDAVWDSLINGKLAGYGSDVWWRAPKRGESESSVSDKHRFEDLDNIVMSPHRAGFSENALPHLDDVIINLSHFIKGESLINIVSLDKGF